MCVCVYKTIHTHTSPDHFYLLEDLTLSESSILGFIAEGCLMEEGKLRGNWAEFGKSICSGLCMINPMSILFLALTFMLTHFLIEH